MQEDSLGRVMPHLRHGKIFDVNQFAHAVRSYQMSKDLGYQHVNQGSSKAKRAKYENEVQSFAYILLDKNEDPFEEDDLGDLNVDAFNISKIGHNNYKLFFERKIEAASTGSIKLKPAFMAKSESQEYDKIENRTKSEICKEISAIMEQITFNDENERKFFEGKVQRNNTKKDELVEIFNQLKSKLVFFGNI